MLNPGDVAAEDVAGTILLRAYREYAKQSASEHSKETRARGPWLNELATKQIQWTIDRLQATRSRGIALQQDIPETPPEEKVSTLGEEVLYFYQPDEDLHVEDIFPDMDMSTPEEFVAAKEELLHCVNTALAGSRYNGSGHCGCAMPEDLPARSLPKCSTRTRRSRARPGICARASASDSGSSRLQVYQQGEGQQFVSRKPKIVSSDGA